jgi:trimethylamine:corrinoid methyltransferase-like protein
MSEARRTRPRVGGCKSRLAARAHPAQTIVPYLDRKLPPYEVLGEEGLETIEQNAETILEETGIDFRDDAEALAIWKRMLDEYEAPEIDPGLDEAFQDHSARHNAERPGTLY